MTRTLEQQVEQDIAEFKLRKWLSVLSEALPYAEACAKEYDLRDDHMEKLLRVKQDVADLVKILNWRS